VVRTSILALIVACSVVGAADTPKLVLPAEVKGEIGDFIVVRADTDSPVVRWRAITPGLKVFPGDLLTDKKCLVVSAAKEGRYRVMAWCAKGDIPSEAVDCIVVVGPDSNPGPPNPPKPPPPPPPTPPDPPKPPEPDSFTKRVLDAWKADPADADTKKKAATTLQGLYLELAAEVLKKEYTTVDMFRRVMQKTALGILDPDILTEPRKILGSEVFGRFPDDPDSALDEATRANANTLFKKLAEIMGGLR
jgi:hypothetical protein